MSIREIPPKYSQAKNSLYRFSDQLQAWCLSFTPWFRLLKWLNVILTSRIVGVIFRFGWHTCAMSWTMKFVNIFCLSLFSLTELLCTCCIQSLWQCLYYVHVPWKKKNANQQILIECILIPLIWYRKYRNRSSDGFMERKIMAVEKFSCSLEDYRSWKVCIQSLPLGLKVNLYLHLYLSIYRGDI